MKIRKSEERGKAHFGWLDARHTFSFGEYYDPQHMSYRALRVLNEDRIAPSGGFPTHPHRDMEIVTYILEGSLEHKDSMGNGSTIAPGEIQRMSAGTGITHSEFNPSDSESTHLFQIWIEPDRTGHTPGYEQIRLDPERFQGRFDEIAGPEGKPGAVTIHQDATIELARLAPQQKIEGGVEAQRYVWIQVARGAVTAGETRLEAGDALALEPGEPMALESDGDSELIRFSLA